MLRRAGRPLAAASTAGATVRGGSPGAPWAFVVAVAPVVPGFLRAATTPNYTGQLTDPTLSDTLYNYAWFVTFAVGFVVDYALMRGHESLQEEG